MAVSNGLRVKANATPVPSFRRSVAAAAVAKGKKGEPGSWIPQSPSKPQGFGLFCIDEKLCSRLRGQHAPVSFSRVSHSRLLGAVYAVKLKNPSLIYHATFPMALLENDG
jgi:hypothetical protein